MVLKKGNQRITAVGLVVERDGIHKGCGDKEWLFDYDGWFLPEYCYVDWKKPDNPIPVGEGLNIRGISKLNNKELQEVAGNILRTETTVLISDEPSETREVKDDEILRFLIKEGLRLSSSDEITSNISKIRLLADYYDRQYEGDPEEYIGEHETRTFLVIPLLFALGWSEQQIKIESKCGANKKIDIACFRTPCKSKNMNEWKKECVAIIETKSFRTGLDCAYQQAKTYSENFPSCQALITTNGYCYKVYLRKDNQFQGTPSAYINLLRQRNKYPLDPENVGGALEAIKWLLPNNLIVL